MVVVQIKTTHYVKETRNPGWDVSTECIVTDYTRTVLYFILYDWDGSSPSEDDFLGSAHMCLARVSRRVRQRTKCALSVQMLLARMCALTV